MAYILPLSDEKICLTMTDLVFPNNPTLSHTGLELSNEAFSTSSDWVTYSADDISRLLEGNGCRYAERLVQGSLNWLRETNGFHRLSEVVKVTSGLVEVFKMVSRLEQQSSGAYLQECPDLKAVMSNFEQTRVINDIALKVVQFAEQNRSWYRVNTRFLITNILEKNPFQEDARRETQRILGEGNLDYSTDRDWDEQIEQTFQISYRSRVMNAAEDILPRVLNDVYDLIEGYAFRQVAENPTYIAQVGKHYEASITDALRLVLIQSTVSSEGTTSLWNADGPLAYGVLKILEEFRDELRSNFASHIAPAARSIISQRRFMEGLRNNPSMEDILRRIEERFLDNGT